MHFLWRLHACVTSFDFFLYYAMMLRLCILIYVSAVKAQKGTLRWRIRKIIGCRVEQKMDELRTTTKMVMRTEAVVFAWKILTTSPTADVAEHFGKISDENDDFRFRKRKSCNCGDGRVWSQFCPKNIYRNSIFSYSLTIFRRSIEPKV